jgi:hypothetical protein
MHHGLAIPILSHVVLGELAAATERRIAAFVEPKYRDSSLPLRMTRPHFLPEDKTTNRDRRRIWDNPALRPNHQSQIANHKSPGSSLVRSWKVINGDSHAERSEASPHL